MIETRRTPSSLAGISLVREGRVGTDFPYIVGYAAMFYNAADPGTQYQLADDIMERLCPGCFDRAIAEDDVLGLVNHNIDQLLGRVASGTMSLRTDSKGLKYSMELPDTTVGRDLREYLARGDITGSSFSFLPLDTKWTEVKGVGMVREVREVQLFDCGPVTMPAYRATTAGLQSQPMGGLAVTGAAPRSGGLGGRLAAYKVRARLAELGMRSS